jgi:hypothetical protein
LFILSVLAPAESAQIEATIICLRLGLDFANSCCPLAISDTLKLELSLAFIACPYSRIVLPLFVKSSEIRHPVTPTFRRSVRGMSGSAEGGNRHSREFEQESAMGTLETSSFSLDKRAIKNERHEIQNLIVRDLDGCSDL